MKSLYWAIYGLTDLDVTDIVLTESHVKKATHTEVH